jgi:hypothetical protein
MTTSKVKIIDNEKGIYTSNIRAVEIKSDKKNVSPKEFFESLTFRRGVKTDNKNRTK